MEVFIMLPSVFGERLFDNVFGNPFMMMSAFNSGHDSVFGKHGKNLMKTDVRELEHSYELDVDLPGFKKEEVKVELDDGYLTITASKGLDREEKGCKGQYIRRERCCGEASRSFYVGQGLEPKDVTAKFEDGILRLSFPKVPEPKQPENRLISIM